MHTEIPAEDYNMGVKVVIPLPEPEVDKREFHILGVDNQHVKLWKANDLGYGLFKKVVAEALNLGPTIAIGREEKSERYRGRGLRTHRPWVYLDLNYDKRTILYDENNVQALVDLRVLTWYGRHTNSYAVSSLYAPGFDPDFGRIQIKAGNKRTIDRLARRLHIPRRIDPLL